MFSFVNAILNFQFNKKIFKNLPRITNVVTDGKLKINILIFLSMFPSIKFNWNFQFNTKFSETHQLSQITFPFVDDFVYKEQ